MIERSGLIQHYQAEKEGQERVENLGELVNAAAAFVQEEGYGADAPGTQGEAAAAIPSPLAGFLSHASLEAGDNQAEAGQDALQLMTVHAAKGLEFFAVFITGLEEGLFPHENSLTEMDGLEEERRLMYVAITRARRRLYVSFAQSRLLHGQTRYGIRSRFLEELPENAVKWLTPRVAAHGGGGRFGQWHDPGARASRAAPRRGRAHSRRTASGSGSRCATRSSARASSSTSRAAATTRACRSTSACTASSGCWSPWPGWSRPSSRARTASAAGGGATSALRLDDRPVDRILGRVADAGHHHRDRREQQRGQLRRQPDGAQQLRWRR